MDEDVKALHRSLMSRDGEWPLSVALPMKNINTGDFGTITEVDPNTVIVCNVWEFISEAKAEGLDEAHATMIARHRTATYADADAMMEDGWLVSG